MPCSRKQHGLTRVGPNPGHLDPESEYLATRPPRSPCPWELLYADDLMISGESMSIKELLVKLKTLKSEMAKKG